MEKYSFIVFTLIMITNFSTLNAGELASGSNNSQRQRHIIPRHHFENPESVASSLQLENPINMSQSQAQASITGGWRSYYACNGVPLTQEQKKKVEILKEQRKFPSNNAPIKTLSFDGDHSLIAFQTPEQPHKNLDDSNIWYLIHLSLDIEKNDALEDLGEAHKQSEFFINYRKHQINDSLTFHRYRGSQELVIQRMNRDHQDVSKAVCGKENSFAEIGFKVPVS